MLSPWRAEIGTIGLRRQAEFGEERGDFIGHGLEAHGVEIDEVDLVDDDRNLPQSQELQDEGMAARLFAHTFGGIDHQQGRLGLGDAGDGVLQEFLVPRRVDDDIGALGGLEEDLRRVDGDALVALGLEGIQQERPFQRTAALVAGGLEFGELAFGQAAGVMQQAADQGRLAVIDMADDGEGKRACCGAISSLACGHEGLRGLEGMNGHDVLLRRLHVAGGAQALEGVLAFMVHGAAGALRGLGRAQFGDDLVEAVGVARRPAR